MAKEHFFLAENDAHLKLLDEAARRASVSRGQVFDDFLHMAVCAFSAGQMEDEYLSVVQKYATGPKGKRGIDSLSELLGRIVATSETTRDDIRDVLGDLFEGGISYGEAGQYLTPMPVCRLNAQVLLGGEAEVADAPVADTSVGELEPLDAEPAPISSTEPKSVYDPACGSGRMLLAVAEIQRRWTFVGRDIDLRCVRMTCLNLALRNLYGYVIHGNSLKDEVKLVYRTGLNARGGVIRYGSVRELNEKFGVIDDPDVSTEQHDSASHLAEAKATTAASQPNLHTGKQLRLF